MALIRQALLGRIAHRVAFLRLPFTAPWHQSGPSATAEHGPPGEQGLRQSESKNTKLATAIIAISQLDPEVIFG